jgi:hypothetical protein
MWESLLSILIMELLSCKCSLQLVRVDLYSNNSSTILYLRGIASGDLTHHVYHDRFTGTDVNLCMSILDIDDRRFWPDLLANSITCIRPSLTRPTEISGSCHSSRARQSLHLDALDSFWRLQLKLPTWPCSIS